MDILLDPNIAYLFVVGGILLAFLAIVTPGTGVLELGAIFCMILAAYGIYHLSFTWWALILIGLSVIPFVYAIAGPKRELYLGLSILAFAIGSVFIFPSVEGGSVVNPLVAAVATLLVGGFLWIAARKSIEAAKKRPAHDLDSLIGQVGEARTDVHEEGSVQVGKELWSARSEQLVPAGSQIKVLRRDGFVVVIEKVIQP